MFIFDCVFVRRLEVLGSERYGVDGCVLKLVLGVY